ncbi:hypothetical protein LshimejAT787_2100470 [Lyophyllum shimeji]|uniref:Uncharacterized protein n=1 Tax=Lyophyllum shimeji TaxID=47721 RepID=A0A9P3Q1W3_LYOSH|nr:hypothetical protein LshimejAT787_2100470 [Lyophyllum shimeji]
MDRKENARLQTCHWCGHTVHEGAEYSTYCDGLLVSIVLDGGSRKHFSGIRLIIVYKESDDFDNVELMRTLFGLRNVKNTVWRYNHFHRRRETGVKVELGIDEIQLVLPSTSTPGLADNTDVLPSRLATPSSDDSDCTRCSNCRVADKGNDMLPRSPTDLPTKTSTATVWIYSRHNVQQLPHCSSGAVSAASLRLAAEAWKSVCGFGLVTPNRTTPDRGSTRSNVSSRTGRGVGIRAYTAGPKRIRLPSHRLRKSRHSL